MGIGVIPISPRGERNWKGSCGTLLPHARPAQTSSNVWKRQYRNPYYMCMKLAEFVNSEVWKNLPNFLIEGQGKLAEFSDLEGLENLPNFLPGGMGKTSRIF